ncbi:MAG: heavy-metal-associated domain-containing protein [Alkalinema sp. FL-bin-369]|nr:heavy-metal-associated domain-containing protein [Leptolyngbyaceae cyanobacterium LF-bin-369]
MTSQPFAQAQPIVFTVPDMMCGSCGKKIIAAVTGVDPTSVVTADPETKLVTILTRCDEGMVRDAIEQVGFEVAP